MNTKTRVPTVMLSGVIGAVMGVTVPSASFASGSCYVAGLYGGGVRATSDSEWDYSKFAIRYVTESVGSLNTDAEVWKFNHLKQAAFDVTGKGTLVARREVEAAIGGGTSYLRAMVTASGAAIKGTKVYGTYPKDAPGAHLGLTLHLLRGSGEINIGPIFVECTSSTTSPTPGSWKCNGKIEGQVGAFNEIFGIQLPFVLYKVDPTKVKACSVFEDGYYFPELPPLLPPG